MNCPSCQTTLADGSRFCGGCGKAFSSTETQVGDSGSRMPEMAGREIAGRYRIVSKLGEGGMGAVFRAEQISLKRAVALKLLRPEMSTNATLVRRFNAEAELVAKLSHPNTVNIYDFGQDADGSLFIAMELIEGHSLRALLRQSAPLPPPRALAIASQLAASLTDAHAHGIIHRDLKPDNAMLQERGRERDIVRVLDFGIAKLRDDTRATQAMMTQAGDMLGTPQYMAPEQIRSEAIDGRTDVYALGCILYEMLTGRMAFEGTTVMALLSKHLTELPVAPSVRRPDLGLWPALDGLVLSALEKIPAARPATMEAYGERIDALLAALGQVATGPTMAVAQSHARAPSQPAWIAPMGYAGFEGHPPAAPEPLPTPAPPVRPAAIADGYGGHGVTGPAASGLAAARAAAGPTEMVDPLPRPALVRGPGGTLVTSTMPMPAAKKRSGLVTALAVLGAVGVLGIGAGVVVSLTHKSETAANDPWNGGTRSERTADPTPTTPADVPPPPLKTDDTLPTTVMGIPFGADLSPPHAVRIPDEPGRLHFVDRKRETDYILAPLIPGTNDPQLLIKDWLSKNPGMSFVSQQPQLSAGTFRTSATFQGTAPGFGKRPVTQSLILYIAQSYRLVLVIQMPTSQLSTSYIEDIDKFLRTGVDLP